MLADQISQVKTETLSVCARKLTVTVPAPVVKKCFHTTVCSRCRQCSVTWLCDLRDLTFSLLLGRVSLWLDCALCNVAAPLPLRL